MAEQETNIHIYKDCIKKWLQVSASSEDKKKHDGDFVLFTIKKEREMNMVVGPQLTSAADSDDEDAKNEFEWRHGNSGVAKEDGAHAATACLDAMRCLVKGHVWTQDAWDADYKKSYESYGKYEKTKDADRLTKSPFLADLKKADVGARPCYAIIKLDPIIIGIALADDDLHNVKKKMLFSRCHTSVFGAFSQVKTWIKWNSLDDVLSSKLDELVAANTITVT